MPLFPPQAYRKTAYTHRRGLAADKPLAANVLSGTLYFSTDTFVLERSTGVAWETYGIFDGTEVIIGTGFPEFRINIVTGTVRYSTSADDIYEWGGDTPATMFQKYSRGTNDAIGTQFTLLKNRLGGAVSNNDVLGDFAWNAFTDAEYQLAVFRAVITDATPTAEDTAIQFYHASNGSLVNILNTFAPGIVDLPQGQLRFPGTQNPSADVNTLDDYEEGTWTPTFGGTTSESGQVYSTQNAYYTKIGGLVWVTANIVLSTLGTITGNVTIKGLPFAPTADGGATWALFGSLTSAMTGLGGFMSGGGGAIIVLMYTAGVGGVNILFVVQADFSNTTQVFIGATYRAD